MSRGMPKRVAKGVQVAEMMRVHERHERGTCRGAGAGRSRRSERSRAEKRQEGCGHERAQLLC